MGIVNATISLRLLTRNSYPSIFCDLPHPTLSTMEDGKNANPLILNPSDLPTRRRRASARADLSNGTVTFAYPAPSFTNDPFLRLEESLPPRFRVDVRIKEGTHSTADEVNKQLADKERVAAALWNPTLQSFIKKMLETCE